MARLTEKLVQHIWDKTSHCFQTAVIIVYDLQGKNLPSGPPFDSRDLIPELKEEIDRVYRRLLCELPTEDLLLIIEARDKGKIRRAQVTIDAITTELFERELSKDQNRSYNPSDDNSPSKGKVTRRRRLKKEGSPSTSRRVRESSGRR